MDDKEHPIRNAAIIGFLVTASVFAFEWAGTPYTEPDYRGPKLTKAEQSTVNLAYDFNDCVKAELSTVTQEELNSYLSEVTDGGTNNVQLTMAERQNHFDSWAEQKCATEMNLDKAALDSKMDVIENKYGMGLVL